MGETKLFKTMNPLNKALKMTPAGQNCANAMKTQPKRA